MKTSNPSGFQYSGYPLQIADEKAKANLQVVKSSKPQELSPSSPTTKRIDDPSNWDESWFGNYE